MGNTVCIGSCQNSKFPHYSSLTSAIRGQCQNGANLSSSQIKKISDDTLSAELSHPTSNNPYLTTLSCQKNNAGKSIADFHITQDAINKAKLKAEKNAQIEIKSNKYPHFPYINHNGKKIDTDVVVSLKDFKAFVYDKGNLKYVFNVATGKKGMETKPGLREIYFIDKYPFTKQTKRNNESLKHGTENEYGPVVIITDSPHNQFMHGTNEPTKIGQKASQGCVRLENTDAMAMSQLVTPHKTNIRIINSLANDNPNSSSMDEIIDLSKRDSKHK